MKPMSEDEYQEMLGKTLRGPARTVKINTPVGSLFLGVEATDGEPEFVITAAQKLEDSTLAKTFSAIAKGFTKLVKP